MQLCGKIPAWMLKQGARSVNHEFFPLDIWGYHEIIGIKEDYRGFTCNYGHLYVIYRNVFFRRTIVCSPIYHTSPKRFPRGWQGLC